MIRFLAAPLCMLALAGCSDGSTSVVIENKSSAKLQSVQASGPGFAAYVGELRPGERNEIKIYPRGEAGLALAFKANGHVLTSPVTGYFESGDKVSVIVAQDMSVDIDAKF